MKRDNCNGEVFGAEKLISNDEEKQLGKSHASEMANWVGLEQFNKCKHSPNENTDSWSKNP